MESLPVVAAQNAKKDIQTHLNSISFDAILSRFL
jgi:hypothetical protein